MKKPVTLTVIAFTAAAAAAGLLLWPDGLDRLEDRDPNGAAACETVIAWLNGELAEEYPTYGSDGIETLTAVTAGGLASRATTESIRNAHTGSFTTDPFTGYEGGEELHHADLRKLYKACTDEGVDMPDKDGKL